MVSVTRYHNFEQCLIFFNGDVHNILDLGGEVELTLGEQDGEPEKFVFTRATIVDIRAGLRHGPINFKKVNDPGKPILYNNITFTVDFARKT